MRKVCLTCKKEYTDGSTSCVDDGGDLMPVLTDPMIGTVIADKYELLSVLGVGGMSTIYKAKHKYMGRLTAVKLLHPYLVSDTSMFQRFQYEAKAASNLNHPNVVGVHDFGITDSGVAYLVMDYLEGEDLSTILERQIFLPEAQAREVIRQACLGLDHAHSKGVIHRDLKPSNLFLMPDGDGINVKLVDFGIAKVTDTDNGIEGGQHLTRTGEVFGSPLYMSPEQCSGKPLDARSDQYSFGILMYEVLTGRRPIAGATAIDTMHKHLKEPAPAFKAMAPTVSVSPAMEAAVLKCLAKKPDDRFESIAAFYAHVYGEEIPRSNMARTPTPSTSLKIRAAGTEDEVKAAGTGAGFGQFVTGQAKANAPTTLSKLALAYNGQNTTTLHKLIVPGSAMILLTGGLITVAAVWVMFFWDGPKTDHGRMFDRWRYTYYLSRGESMMSQQHYVEAEAELKEAEKIADSFGDNFGRVMNVYRSELTLYRRSNQYDKQAAMIALMTEVGRKRAHKDYATAMNEVAQINDILDKKKHGVTHLGKRELELQLSAVIDGIRDVASRLGAVQDYDHQETLLTRTIATYSQLVRDDDPQLAGLTLDLAECHVQQDEFDEARPLFKKSLDTYLLAHKNGRENVREIDVANAWLRIGQFDRDRSNFKDGGVELTNAYNMLKKYGTAKDAAESGGAGNKAFIECLNALADYSDQINKPNDGKKYRQEAIAAKKMRKELSLGADL